MLEPNRPPTPVAKRFVTYVVGFSVFVGLGVAPFLGALRIKGFNTLLQLFPETMQKTVTPLGTFIMAVVAVAVQFYSRERVARRGIRRQFLLSLVTLIITFVVFTTLYQLWVQRVAVPATSQEVAFVIGLQRLPQCTCGTLSDNECIEQLSFKPAAIASCWGDAQIKVHTLILSLLYLVMMTAFGGLIGLIILQERADRRIAGARPRIEPV